MKLTNLLKCAVLAACVAMVGSQTTKAATITTAQGHLILGFYILGQNGNPPTDSDVLTIDLGAASQFYTATAGSSFTISGLSVNDLIAAYGSGWFSNPLLNWGVIGSAGNTSGVFDSTNNIRKGTLWSTLVPGQGSRNATTLLELQNPDGASEAVRGNANGQTSTANSSTAFIDSINSANSYWAQDNAESGTNFKTLTGLDNSFANAIGNVETSELWQQQPGTSLATTGSSKLLGSFSLNSAGVLTFTAAPEPSTVVLAIGAGLAMLARRRRLAVRA